MSKTKKVLIVAVILTVILSILVFCCFVFYALLTLSEGGFTSGIETTTLFEGDTDETVAVVDLEGAISSAGASDLWGNSAVDMTTRTIQKLRAVENNDNIDALILRVNTPGGEVYATRQIYNQILRIQDAGKPVVVLMEDMAASGGYYIAAPADHIVASEMSLTGSIGVVFSTIDLSGLYDKVGIKQIAVANSDGNLKVLEDISDKDSEGYKLLQGIADDYYDNFVTVVAKGRDMAKKDVIELADGRVYSGKQALNNGLIDSLGEFEEAREQIIEIAELDNPSFVLVKTQDSSFTQFSLRLLKLFNPLSDVLLSEDIDGIKAQYILQF